VGEDEVDSFESGPLRRREISTMTVQLADTVTVDGSYAKKCTVCRVVSACVLDESHSLVDLDLKPTNEGSWR
jgi:hypothetical protein